MRPWVLGRVAGIAVQVHPTFLILPVFFGGWYGFWAGSWMVAGTAALTVLLIFACILGHEMSHSFCAKALGIEVPTITFYPMGGVASLERTPRQPGQEALIAAVGPLFNFVLAAVLYVPLTAWIGAEALHAPNLHSWRGAVANAFWANPVLGAFNLLPAFPMDGGRILRAFLVWRSGSWRRATRISAFLGQLFAIGFMLLGLRWQSWMLLLVGVYVFGAASRESRAASVDAGGLTHDERANP